MNGEAMIFGSVQVVAGDPDAGPPENRHSSLFPAWTQSTAHRQTQVQRRPAVRGTAIARPSALYEARRAVMRRAASVSGDEQPMLDREKIVAVLKRRFPGSASDQVAAAANAIIGLEDEWDEFTVADANPCRESCYLALASARGVRFKVLKKRTAD